MARCPELDTENTGWFSWKNTCRLTGATVGDEHDRTKVDYLCAPKDCSCQYENCPVYRSKRY